MRDLPAKRIQGISGVILDRAQIPTMGRWGELGEWPSCGISLSSSVEWGEGPCLVGCLGGLKEPRHGAWHTASTQLP